MTITNNNEISLTNNNETSLLKSVSLLFPYFLDTKKVGSVINNFLATIAYIFNINTTQLNEMFTRTFIMEAEGDDLTALITDLTGIKRKNGETDADYRTRYFKYTYQYNITEEQVNNIVKDITTEFPIKIRQGTDRGFYWGTPDNERPVGVIDTRTYYNDVDEHISYWSGSDDNSLAWTAYIYLKTEPTADQLDELITVIESVRMRGTTIYLVLPKPNDTIFELANFTGSGNFTSSVNSPANDMNIIADDRIFEYDIIDNTNYRIEDLTSYRNSLDIKYIRDTETVFLWEMTSTLLLDSSQNINIGIITSLYFLNLIMSLPFTSNTSPVQDETTNNNDLTVTSLGLPSDTMLLWEIA